MTLAPAITRVHKLFRLRTVANNAEGGVTSHQVAEILVNNRLSSVSILEDQDHERRARDHVMNCLLLGMLTKHNTETYVYEPTKIAATKLKEYSFEDACPKDLDEMAFFADRLCRLKLSNSQLRGKEYESFRTRPLMNILRILNDQTLHIYNIHYLLSLKQDFVKSPDIMKRAARESRSYLVNDDESVNNLFRGFIRTEKERKEVFRSTKPLMDWCQQAGLVYTDDYHWYRITEKGTKAWTIHSGFSPIWYDDFTFDAVTCSSLALAFNVATVTGKGIDTKKLDRYEKSLLSEMRETLPIQKSKGRLSNPIIFELETDIPHQVRSEVEERAKIILKNSGIPAKLLLLPSFASLKATKDSFASSTEERDLSLRQRSIGVELPRPEQFQTGFEYESCVRLILLGFRAIPYRGEYEGECDLRIATDNPDVVIRNPITTLVECKSIAEWGPRVKLGKRVFAEIVQYQEYVEEVDANSALFICESPELDEERYMNRFYERDDLDRIVIANSETLVGLRRDTERKRRFEEALESPNSYNLRERIFYN